MVILSIACCLLIFFLNVLYVYRSGVIKVLRLFGDVFCIFVSLRRIGNV